jgi:hypothetical protein
MSLRPGTKYFGSSLRDSGAEYLEFVSSVEDVALVELTDGTMRLWIGDDAHALELLSRPAVNTTVTLDDTGWVNASTGGSISGSLSTADIIPTMTAATTMGIEITASSEHISGGFAAWKAADDDNTTRWLDTGGGSASTLPSWWNVDFGSGNSKAIAAYSIRAPHTSGGLNNTPSAWRLITSNFDTGTFATDTGKWTLQDERSSETGWAVSEKRTYETDEGDTGTVTARRHWRLFFTALNGDTDLNVAEIEMFTVLTGATNQVSFENGAVVLNAAAIGSIAKATKRVIVSDTGTEHSLDINVDRGPVTIRVGSTNGDDDYVSETALGTGHHNLAFTPLGDFWITLQNEEQVDRIISSLSIGDSGTVEVTTPWGAENLADIRYDQSADVVYVDCADIQPHKIERRGTGRSWSAVEYAPSNGPFLTGQTSTAKLKVSHPYGNTTMDSSIPFFSPSHVGALFKLNHSGQSGEWALGALDAATDSVKVTGINDTGTKTAQNERRIVFTVAGTWAGSITIERSFDGPDFGFRKGSSTGLNVTGNLTDTGTFTTTVDDPDDNLQVWYRAKITSYTSGTPVVRITYLGGQVTGIARVTDYIDNQNVDIEVISRFSDTGYAESWQEGYWSDLRGYPTAVALHGGRLGHANGANLFLSVSDDFENFDQETDGDAGPIIRTLGSGPVDSIHYLISLLRLIVGTAGAELTVRSSSLDEPLTPDNSSASAFSTQGSANMRAVKMDTRSIMVQRSGQRVFMIGPAENSLADYEAFDLTLLVPDLLAAGVRSVAIQRQPDTRIHCVLADGTVAILTYEPQEEVVCWTMWETDGAVEKAMVLPGLSEDAVYYHIRRQVGMSNDSYTKVLLHFDGSDGSTTFVDDNAGGSAHTWTATGNTHIDTAQSKFGGSAALFDGTGDYISTPDHADFALGASDFTIDAQFYVTVATGSARAIIGQTDAGLTAAGSAFVLRRESAGHFTFRLSNGSAFSIITGTTQFSDSLNAGWHHIAVVRTGNVLKMFIDGAQEGGDVAFTGSVNNTGTSFFIGARDSTNADAWQGWIDEVRLSVGIARLTASFTPPTRAYGPDNVRYLEKWAMETECEGDTGLHWLADCAVSFSDTGRSTSFSAAALHLAGKQVIAWGDLDTGSTPYVDLSSGVGALQATYTVDTGTGDIAFPALTSGVHQGVVGLPYKATWISSKLAYAAEAGTALVQQKRFAQVGLVAYNIHARGLEVGNDTGRLKGLPSMIENGGRVDPDKIFRTFDQLAFAVDGKYSTDERLVLRATAPRPCTLLAAVVAVQTSDRV